MSGRLPDISVAGRHDSAMRRRAQRRGRERGCWVYIAGEQLAELHIDPYASTPFYRIWPGRKRTALVQFYSEP